MSEEEFYSNAIDLGNENQVNDLIIQIQEKNYKHLKQKYDELQQKIDKAIEYIKFEWQEIMGNKDYSNHLWTIDGLVIKRLLDILRGEDV